MFRFLIAMCSILASFICLWSLVMRTFRDGPLTRAGVLATTFGLSAGMLSLYMLALGLLPGEWLRPALALPLPWFLFGFGMWRTKNSIPPTGGRRRSLTFWLTMICLTGMAVIAFNTVSYPFYRYDVLARFAPNAPLLFDCGAVPANLTAYPVRVEMLYTFAFMA